MTQTENKSSTSLLREVQNKNYTEIQVFNLFFFFFIKENFFKFCKTLCYILDIIDKNWGTSIFACRGVN